MDDNKPLLVIFPYVALDDPLEIRGEILFPSTFLTLEQENIDEEGHWYDNERKEALNQLKLYLKTHLGFDQAFFDEAGAMLVKIKGLFYWYTNEQVDNVIWCFLPASSSPKRRHQFKTHLEEIRKILGYLWCIPDARPQFFSLSGNYEQLDYYSFIPENAVWVGGLHCIRFLPQQSEVAEEIKYVNGYQYSVNLDWVGNIIEDCRIYPSSRSIFDRRGDGLARILEALERKTLKSNVHSLFNLDGVPHSQTDRIFDALEWFNRSCYSEITTDVSLIYLAIAYETLLFPPRKAGFDDRNPKSINLYNSIRLVVGDLPRLEQWVEQFYNARSRIMHEGKSSKIRLVIQDKNTQSPPTVNEYGSLIHYGWLIFRICLNSVLTGLSNASAIDLQARFFSNKDRLEQIWKVLDQTTDPFDVITLITDDIRVLSNIEMRDNQSFKVELLLTIARLLAHRLMSLVDETEEQIALQKILVPRYHIQFDDEIEIVEYARLVFENISKDELPEKVIKLAIRDLSSDTPPSLQKIRQKIRGILKRNKNKLSDESQRRLKNVVALIECSFIRFQLISVIDIADSVSSLHISKHRPFSLMEGYAFFVKDNIDTMKSNTTLSMSLFKSHMEGQSDRSHLQ